MANYYVSSVAYAALPAWAASTAVALGLIIQPLAPTGTTAGHCFVCTTAGTTGATEPAWGAGLGATTTSGTAVFTCVTGVESYQSPGAWTAPAGNLNCILTSSTRISAGIDAVYVASTHAETYSTSNSVGASTASIGIIPVVCVNSGAGSHIPPLSSDITTGASITQTGNSLNSMTIAQSYVYFNGIAFNMADPSTNGYQFAITSLFCRMDNCAIAVTTASTSSSILLGTGTVLWNNVNVSFANSSQRINIQGAAFIWRKGSMNTGATTLIALFGTDPATASRSGKVFCEGVDFSLAKASSIFIGNYGGAPEVTLQTCVMGTYTTLLTATGQSSQGPSPSLTLINCSGGASTYYHAKATGNVGSCTLTANTTVVRTGGASDGATAYSWAILNGLNSSTWLGYFESFPIAVWNSSPGVAASYTIHGIVNSASLPNNDDIWLSLDYFGSGTTTQSTETSGTKSDLLAAPTPLTADSVSAWDGGLTARANSTTYSVGDIVKVSSNPGRAFFCTFAGTSAASLPAGYASAVDGDSVSDGGATFRAAMRFQQTLTITPLAAGFVRGYVRAAKDSTVFYIDPVLDT